MLLQRHAYLTAFVKQSMESLVSDSGEGEEPQLTATSQDGRAARLRLSKRTTAVATPTDVQARSIAKGYVDMSPDKLQQAMLDPEFKT